MKVVTVHIENKQKKRNKTTAKQGKRTNRKSEKKKRQPNKEKQTATLGARRLIRASF